MKNVTKERSVFFLKWLLRAAYVLALVSVAGLCLKFYFDINAQNQNDRLITQLAADVSKLNKSQSNLSVAAKKIATNTKTLRPNPYIFDEAPFSKFISDDSLTPRAAANLDKHKKLLAELQYRASLDMEKFVKSWEAVSQNVKNEIINTRQDLSHTNEQCTRNGRRSD